MENQLLPGRVAAYGEEEDEQGGRGEVKIPFPLADF